MKWLSFFFLIFDPTSDPRTEPTSIVAATPPVYLLLVRPDRGTEVRTLAQMPVELGSLEGVSHTWLWASHLVPRRVPVGRVAAELRAALHHSTEVGAGGRAQDVRRLEVLLDRGPGEKRVGGLLLAAPVALWQEVPEHMVPAWEIGGLSQLYLPWNPDRPWRLRRIGERGGSWWLDVPPGVNRVAVPTAQGEDVAIQVLGENDRPLEQVSASVLRAAGREQVLATVQADERGRLFLPAVPSQQELSLVVSAASHVPRTITGPASSLSGRLQLWSGFELCGRFIDPQGRSLAGVQVRGEAWLAGSATALVQRGTASDAQGRFCLPSLPPGRIAIEARADGYSTHTRQVILEASDLDLGAVPLQPGHTLYLRIVNDLGEPVVRARVSVSGAAAAYSDRRGRAEVGGLGAGPMEIDVRAAEHIPLVQKRVTVRGTSEQTPGTVTLQRAYSVEGRLVDAQGVPAEGGRVRTRAEGQFSDHILGRDGRFRVSLEPGRTWSLELSSGRLRRLIVPVPVGQPGEARDLGDLVAESGMEIVGTLLRQEDGAPVAGAEIWVPVAARQGPLLSWLTEDLHRARSGPDGRFRLTGLEPAALALRVDAPGFARRQMELVPEPDAPRLDLGVIYLTRGAQLRVHVDGELEMPALARVDPGSAWLEMDLMQAPVIDGQASFGNVPAGRSLLTILDAQGALRCEREVQLHEGEEREVHCDGERIVVSGQVLVGGEPAGRGHLVWRRAGGTEVPGVILNRRSPRGLVRQQVLGAGPPSVEVAVIAEGWFTTEDLSSGDWQVRWWPQSGAAGSERGVSVPSEGVAGLILDFPGQTLRGVVVDTEERGVVGARVSLVGEGRTVLSGADGAFELLLAPGRYRLVAREGKRRSRAIQVAVAEEGVSELLLVLDDGPGQQLPVRVLDPGGKPIAGALVLVEFDHGEQHLVNANALGQARVPLQEPPPQQVRAAAMARGQWALGRWSSVAEVLERGLILTRFETGSLRLWLGSCEQALGLSGGGWDLAALLGRVGKPLVPGSYDSVLVSGLPPGPYQAFCGETPLQVQVEAGQLSEEAF